jgi:hypothetical protein
MKKEKKNGSRLKENEFYHGDVSKPLIFRGSSKTKTLVILCISI